jgi:thiamine-phosphate diphosphorylase / hydroxyethylthiazole kinase
VLTVATEIAVNKQDSAVKGPGTFLPALIDELWTLSAEELLNRANIEVHQGQ